MPLNKEFFGHDLIRKAFLTDTALRNIADTTLESVSAFAAEKTLEHEVTR